MIITKEWLESSMTKGIGLKYKQALLLGLKYPLKKGWKETLIGTNIPDDTARSVYQLGQESSESKRTSITSRTTSHKGNSASVKFIGTKKSFYDLTPVWKLVDVLR